MLALAVVAVRAVDHGTFGVVDAVDAEGTLDAADDTADDAADKAAHRARITAAFRGAVRDATRDPLRFRGNGQCQRGEHGGGEQNTIFHNNNP